MSKNVDNPRRALGKGLSALLPTRPTAQPPVEPTHLGEEVAQLPIELIEPNPLQPRRVFQHDRIEELAQLRQHLYARQHTVFDPRRFSADGGATETGTHIFLDLNLCDIRLRRSIHRLYTRGRLKDDPVFMGEATVMAQPLVTKELANFLCETNYEFSTLKLFSYKPRQ